jgi:cysteine desulfurase/selenocysteine lyase
VQKDKDRNMAIDIERARQETPGCQEVLHFNNAGAALMPQPVLDATIRYLQLEAHIGGYEAHKSREAQIHHTYAAVASLIGCAPDEVALMENATRAWDMAFYAIPFQPGDRILTAMAEYASNYIAYLQIAQRRGVVVEPLPDDAYGQVSLDALRKTIDKRVKLISITHVPTSGGLVNPVEEIGKIAREAGILYLVDACQSVGQMPIDVHQIGCDLLSATGRKYLRGPRGTGFLYVRHEALSRLDPVFLDLHAAQWVAPDRYEIAPGARRFETWEKNYAGLVGLGTAIDYAQQWGLEQIWRRIKTLSYQLRTRLSPLPGVIVHDRGINQCGIVTFTIDNLAPLAIQQRLERQKINVSIAERGSTLLDLSNRQLDSMIRASIHYYNTEEEIEQFCTAIEKML